MEISRYQNNQTKKTRWENLYKSKRMKKIPLNNNDIYVAIQTGDRLDLLSNQYYGSPLLVDYRLQQQYNDGNPD